MYYDRQGNLINRDEFARLFSDEKYKIVQRTEVGETTTISTVWLGIDHSLGSGDPMIFETMIFDPEGTNDCYRYATIEEAIAGHEDALRTKKESTI